MKQGLSKEQAEAAAKALLSKEPKFGDTWIGRVMKRLNMRPAQHPTWEQRGIRKMPEPSGFESPGSPQWGVMHRHTPFE